MESSCNDAGMSGVAVRMTCQVAFRRQVGRLGFGGQAKRSRQPCLAPQSWCSATPQDRRACPQDWQLEAKACLAASWPLLPCVK